MKAIHNEKETKGENQDVVLYLKDTEK